MTKRRKLQKWKHGERVIRIARILVGDEDVGELLVAGFELYESPATSREIWTKEDKRAAKFVGKRCIKALKRHGIFVRTRAEGY